MISVVLVIPARNLIPNNRVEFSVDKEMFSHPEQILEREREREKRERESAVSEYQAGIFQIPTLQ